MGPFDGTGTRVVSYRYDSWGKLVSVEGTLAETLGEETPLNYRWVKDFIVWVIPAASP